VTDPNPGWGTGYPIFFFVGSSVPLAIYIHTFLLLPLAASGIRQRFVSLQFHDHFTGGGKTPRTISSSQGLNLDTGQHTHQTSMPCVGFEPTIPGSKRAKRVHALDRPATVTGTLAIYRHSNSTRPHPARFIIHQSYYYLR
jgi:hypothetical protein